MSKNFTRYAFTGSVKRAQERYGTRNAYARMEKSGDRYRLTAREALFIQARDSFYMATVGENGWPYVQFRGGEKGFLRVIDDTTIGYRFSRQRPVHQHREHRGKPKDRFDTDGLP